MEKLEESSDEITPTMGKESNEEGGQSYVVRKFIVFAAYLMQNTSLRKREYNTKDLYNTSEMDAKCVKVFVWEN